MGGSLAPSAAVMSAAKAVNVEIATAGQQGTSAESLLVELEHDGFTPFPCYGKTINQSLLGDLAYGISTMTYPGWRELTTWVTPPPRGARFLLLSPQYELAELDPSR
jgi:hypothetical protein